MAENISWREHISQNSLRTTVLYNVSVSNRKVRSVTSGMGLLFLSLSLSLQRAREALPEAEEAGPAERGPGRRRSRPPDHQRQRRRLQKGSRRQQCGVCGGYLEEVKPNLNLTGGDLSNKPREGVVSASRRA